MPHRTAAAIATILILCLSHLAAAAPTTQPWPAGHWEGNVSLPSQPMQIKVDLAFTDNTWQGAISFPWNGARSLPLDQVQVAADSVTFSIGSGSDAATFTGRRAKNTLTGNFRQGDLTAPFTLYSGSAPATGPSYSQEPRPPFPYDQHDVTFNDGTITIAGTLTQPRSVGPTPAVILINGSGLTDRDETSFGHRIFLVIADRLTRAGIAVLRCDKRGVGYSGGSTADATLADRADDTLAALAFLKTAPHIDPARIGLLGHSEGALIAPMAANRSADVAFVILLASPGVPGERLLLRQQYLILKADGGDEATLHDIADKMTSVYKSLQSGADSSAIQSTLHDEIELENKLRPADRQLNPAIAAAARAYQLTTPSFLSFLSSDPIPALQQLRRPILVLNGDKDLQAPPSQNIPPIRQALHANKDATVTILPGLNHLFQAARTGSPDEYQSIDETFDDSATKAIIAWITARYAHN